MKRKPLIFSLALLLVVGAALWGVNYRLDHPPLSAANLEFRALVAGADRVQVSQFSCQKQQACDASGTIYYKPLDSTQTRELIENLRFTDDRRTLFNAVPPGTVVLDLTFQSKGADIIRYSLWETPDSCTLNHIVPSVIDSTYRLHPRFVKPLNRHLNRVLPQRIRP